MPAVVPSDETACRSGGTAELDLSIIIATYNGRDVLKRCLESLEANPATCSFEIIVVDDASSDRTAEMVRERFPRVRLLCNEKNVHYGTSNNRAFDVARGRFIYLLNNDTIMRPHAIDAMIGFLREHPEVGAVGSKLLNEDGTVQWSVKSLPNPMSALFGARSIVARLFPFNAISRGHLLHPEEDAVEPFAVGYVSSASLIMPREVMKRVGYLDPRLSYHVDADYCKRVADAGWKVYCLPSVSVVHLNHQGGTMGSRRRRFKSLGEFYLGSYIYFRKHLMRSPWSLLHLAAMGGLGTVYVGSLLTQVFKEAIYVARASARRQHESRR